MNSCCNKSRYNSSAKAEPNVRYKYITIPPLTKGLKLDIASLNTPYGVVWYSHDVTLTIKKKGCSSDCDSSLAYTADVITDNSVSFIFDKEFFKLCRGRYEGLLSIGCDTLNCRLDFHVGQYLCLTGITVQQSVKQDGVTPIVDALDISNPNCCVKCEQKKPCGCFDATQQGGGCSTSFPNEPEEISLDLKILDEEFDALQDWMDSVDRRCIPDKDFKSSPLEYDPAYEDYKLDAGKLQDEVDKIDQYIGTGDFPCAEENISLETEIANPIVDNINCQISVAGQKLSKLNEWINKQNGGC